MIVMNYTGIAQPWLDRGGIFYIDTIFFSFFKAATNRYYLIMTLFVVQSCEIVVILVMKTEK